MAKKKIESEAVADSLEGTVEGEARSFFEREKAEYERRTGETVQFVPPMPLTRTPIGEHKSGESIESIELGESGVGMDQGNAQGDE